MSLTVAQKAFCALLFGAGVGTGYVAPVVKKHVSAPKLKGERVAKASRPRVVRPEPAPPAPILDCPVSGFSISDSAPYAPFGALGTVELGSGAGAVGPFVPPADGSAAPNFPPSVPEPAAWVFLVSGFGLVGLSLRKRKAHAN